MFINWKSIHARFWTALSPWYRILGVLTRNPEECNSDLPICSKFPMFSYASLSKHMLRTLFPFSDYHLNQTNNGAMMKGKNSHPALCLILGADVLGSRSSKAISCYCISNCVYIWLSETTSLGLMPCLCPLQNKCCGVWQTDVVLQFIWK